MKLESSLNWYSISPHTRFNAIHYYWAIVEYFNNQNPRYLDSVNMETITEKSITKRISVESFHTFFDARAEIAGSFRIFREKWTPAENARKNLVKRNKIKRRRGAEN